MAIVDLAGKGGHIRTMPVPGWVYSASYAGGRTAHYRSARPWWCDTECTWNRGTLRRVRSTSASVPFGHHWHKCPRDQNPPSAGPPLLQRSSPIIPLFNHKHIGRYNHSRGHVGLNRLFIKTAHDLGNLPRYGFGHVWPERKRNDLAACLFRHRKVAAPEAAGTK